MLGALLFSLAVTVAPAAASNCAGVHCAPQGQTAPASDTRFGGENLDGRSDRAGLDTQSQRFGNSGIDRRFDTAHDSRFDRTGLDNSGTWSPH